MRNSWQFERSEAAEDCQRATNASTMSSREGCNSSRMSALSAIMKAADLRELGQVPINESVSLNKTTFDAVFDRGAPMRPGFRRPSKPLSTLDPGKGAYMTTLSLI